MIVITWALLVFVFLVGLACFIDLFHYPDSWSFPGFIICTFVLITGLIWVFSGQTIEWKEIPHEHHRIGNYDILLVDGNLRQIRNSEASNAIDSTAILARRLDSRNGITSRKHYIITDTDTTRVVW